MTAENFALEKEKGRFPGLSAYRQSPHVLFRYGHARTPLAAAELPTAERN